MKPRIILVGGGGHCKSCIDVIEQEGKYQIAGIVDIKEKINHKVLGYEIIAADNEIKDLVKQYDYFIVTVGQIKNPDVRKKLFDRLKSLKAKLPIIISPLAYVSRHAQIDEGTIVLHFALINAGAKIGKNCIINTKALIEHDAVVENHCHISTDAVINGGVKVGTGTFFGSNSMTREYIEIGSNCIIGGGVSVLRSVPANRLLKS